MVNVKDSELEKKYRYVGRHPRINQNVLLGTMKKKTLIPPTPGNTGQQHQFRLEFSKLEDPIDLDWDDELEDISSGGKRKARRNRKTKKKNKRKTRKRKTRKRKTRKRKTRKPNRRHR